MKAGTFCRIAGTLLLAGSASATLIQIDISPPSSSALSTINYANGDHAIGIAALNAVAQPASPATGNEIGGGIVFDDVTKILSYSFAYGSDFGFVDLAGNYTTAHFHGNAAVQFPAVNTVAGVQIPLVHTPGSSVNTGSFVNFTAPLTPTQEAGLLSNQWYINIHSSVATGGEIRGQLVPVNAIPEPATLGLALLGLAALRRRFRR